MANPNVAEIQASNAVATGALSWGPKGTALPTDPTTALATGFKGLGYIGSDGIQKSRDVSTDDVKDMNGGTVYVLQTDYSLTYQAELLQSTNVDIKKMIFGSANVVETPASGTAGKRISIQDKGQQADHGSLVADVFNGAAKHREVAADAQPIQVEVGALVSTSVRSYTVTWKVFPDSTGTYVYEYDDDGKPTA